MSDDGMEDGGVWEDRALAAEAEVRRLRAKGLDDFTVTGEEFDRALAEIQRLREALGEKP